ncbi:MAG: aminoacyl-histidine dipeptidase [Bacteroidales bacterium]|nr:aminoacyl-histidine dipeptidase [Lachnoclostridium sp.]MCM1385461.1 aminoacyl-histidine dipeptidase [Lachnoclostridium sp.]MCM1466253.1 aminoacyl-histidine dipeptidase [Bacteroidales bacterium]
MGVLSQLEPKSVFYYFEEITEIPHGSGNVEQISDYLADFAKQRNLFFLQDELKNIIIVKDAAPGYEDEPGVILQGHMDMVAVKKPGCPMDMKTEGLQIGIDGDNIYAKDTSLGGDDGIAVAYALAILDSDTIKHPRLEVVITVDEETGMDGARGIDLSMLKGKRLLNLDSEKEGIFLTSCAGGARVKCLLPVGQGMPVGQGASVGQDVSVGQGAMEGVLCEVAIDGLKGGHSGDEIHKERGNSNALLGRILHHLALRLPFGIVSMEGGLADNAIPRESRAVLVVGKKDISLFEEIVAHVAKQIKEELAVKDPKVSVRVKKDIGGRIGERGAYVCSTPEDAKKMAAFLAALPNGVQAMSADIKGLVETSLNMGILKYNAADEQAADVRAEGAGSLLAEFSVRSSVESAKEALIEKLRAVTCLAGGSVEVTGDYPGWKYRADSPLREKLIRLYEKMYGEKPRLEAIHAGLECGILGSKIKDLDGVSIGPDMKNIHTTEETLSISSTARVWEYLVRLLEEKDID